MPRDKSLSHEKIIQAAIEEFSEYGYDKASMRRMGDRCGMTAAAIYRHFDGKEAIFDYLVRDAAQDLKDWLSMRLSIYERSLEEATQEGRKIGFDAIWKNPDSSLMRELIYPRMDEYSLLINKSHGSSYEGFLDELVDDEHRRVTMLFEHMRAHGYNVRELAYEELHILLTSYCRAIFEPIAHNYSLEDALKYLATVQEFFMAGWNLFMGL